MTTLDRHKKLNHQHFTIINNFNHRTLKIYLHDTQQISSSDTSSVTTFYNNTTWSLTITNTHTITTRKQKLNTIHRINVPTSATKHSYTNYTKKQTQFIFLYISQRLAKIILSDITTFQTSLQDITKVVCLSFLCKLLCVDVSVVLCKCVRGRCIGVVAREMHTNTNLHVCTKL